MEYLGLQPSRRRGPFHEDALPMTPPFTETNTDGGVEPKGAIETAIHVLNTEAIALSRLARLYQTNITARGGFNDAVDSISSSISLGGKVVIIGVGKSGKIGEKLTATMNSLGIMCVSLHPIEALHGDLGMVRENDSILLITYSGRTQEIAMVLQHLPTTLRTIILTAHINLSTVPLTRERENTILLPAIIPEPEEISFGVSAPTTSTTAAMALGDALAIASAQVLHSAEGVTTREVFKRNHPGGAIGMKVKAPRKLADLATSLASMPVAITPEHVEDLRLLDCAQAAIRSPRGWVSIGDFEAIPPRKLQSAADLSLRLSDMPELVCDQTTWQTVRFDLTVADAREWILECRKNGIGTDADTLREGSVLALERDEQVVALVEVEDVLEADP